MKLKPFFCLLLFALISAISCSFNPPTVMVTKKQRIYRASLTGTITEHLAVFVLLEDADGKNDYKELMLCEEATGLEWLLDRNSSVFLQETGFSKNSQWVGSNKFKYPRRFFPAGTYTVRVTDLSGSKTKASFTLQEPPLFSSVPFQFRLQNNQWQIDILEQSGYEFVSLILLTADLQPLTVRQIQSDVSGRYGGTLLDLPDIPTDARYIQCFCENGDRTIGFLSPPLLLP